MAVRKCFVDSRDNKLLSDFDAKVKGGMSEFQAAREVMLSEHKLLHEQINELKATVNTALADKEKIAVQPYIDQVIDEGKINEINIRAEQEKNKISGTKQQQKTIGSAEISEPIELRPALPNEVLPTEVSQPIELTPTLPPKPKERITAAQMEAGQPVVTKSVSSEEPPSKKGRTPVTVSGLTEQERQTMIKQRKAETFVPSKVIDEQKLLDRINKYNKLTRKQKRKTDGLQEANNIRLSVDKFNKTYGEKNTALTKHGDIVFRNKNKTLIKTNNKLTGDLSIDETGVSLMQRSDTIKEVFNDMLEQDLFPTGFTVNGIRMTEDQTEGTIQDILDGIPSRRANNYLNALEIMIEKDDFDFSKPGQPQQSRVTLEMIRQTEKAQTEPLTEEGVMQMLQEQGELTPEQEEVIDNLENLITEYEQPQQTIGDIGQISPVTQERQGAGSTAAEPAATPEATKAEATQTAEDKFNERVDRFADALIDFLTPKINIEGVQKQGLGVPEIVRAGADVIKVAYKIEQNIEKAIAKGIEEMKKLWAQAGNLGQFPEQGLQTFMEDQFKDLIPAKQSAAQPVSQQDADNNFISGILNTDIDAKKHPTIFDATHAQAKQLTAETTGEVQNRVVDGPYVIATQNDLREISILSSKALKDKFGANWGEKTIAWIERNPNQGNLAQLIGVLNVISTENYQDIQNTHDAAKLAGLYSIQKRIDNVTNRNARIASLALNQRRLLRKFATGQNVNDILSQAIFTPEMMELQESLNAILSESVSDDGLNKAIPQAPTPPKKGKTSLIRKVTGKAKQKSDPNLKNELKAKAADISQKSGKSLQQLIDEANEKIKNTKC